MNKQWTICSRNGEPIIIKITNINTGEIENMEFYTTQKIALYALTLINNEDVKKYGVHVQEVGQA